MKVNLFWKKLGYQPKKGKGKTSPRWSEYHFTTKSGPNGHALWTCLRDLASLPEKLYESIKVVGGPDLGLRMDTLRRNLPVLERAGLPVKVGRTRKIVGISDKEGKTREIAVFDYFSQTALRPLHSFLYRVLRRIPSDMTFDQGAFVERVKGWSDPVFYSVDLTAATDRFPISVISQVLRGRFPKEYVDAWEHVMVGETFDVPQLKDRKISYAVGNPMGAYSSWASFALAHHFVVFWCCEDLGIPFHQAPYCLLGDDIVIGSRDLGEAYRHRVDELGVGVSVLKTHISREFFEFAKRFYFRQQEISPFQVSSVIDGVARYNELTSSLAGEVKKGLISVDGIPSAVSELYGFLGRPARFRAKILRRSYLCELGTAVLSGSTLPRFFVAEVMWGRRFLPVGVMPSDELGDHLFRTACLTMFTESSDPERPGDPLGDLAIALMCSLTDPGSGADNEDLPYYLPHLNIHGQVEEAYGRVRKMAVRADTLGKGF